MNMVNVMLAWLGVTVVVLTYFLHVAQRHEEAKMDHEKENTPNTKRWLDRYRVRYQITKALFIALGVFGLLILFFGGKLLPQ